MEILNINAPRFCLHIALATCNFSADKLDGCKYTSTLKTISDGFLRVSLQLPNCIKNIHTSKLSLFSINA